MNELTVTINGTEQRLVGEQTVATLLVRMKGESAPTGVAVAVNETVVPKAKWGDFLLGNGDKVEVITAVQGG